MDNPGMRKGVLTAKWTALLYAALVLGAIYALGLVAGDRVYAMIYMRGLIPHFIIVVSSIAFGYLAYQGIQIAVSRSNLQKLDNFVQSSRDEIVTLAGAEEDSHRDQVALLNHLFKRVPEGRESDLIAVLLRDWIESGQDFTFKRLEVLLDLEIEASENSFKIPSVLAWMAPMLGFLGTVWGIAQSLGNFTGFMGDVDNISRIKDGLGTITAGLGIAFDTTLLGLFFAIIITGIATYLQRKESACLDTLERIAMDVLKRLSVGSPRPDPVSMRHDLRTVDAAGVEALAQAARDMVQQVQSASSEASNPSSELKDALNSFQHYVKYLAKISKQSDILAGEIKEVESAVAGIKNLKGLSESVDNLNRASRDLLKAVKILEKPREFRLVQDVSSKRDRPDE